MAVDAKALRIEGIYQQNDAGQFMLRVKLASGLLSVVQANSLARLGQKYGSGTLHLTTRGSIEFHALEYEQIPLVQRGMTEVGLFSRGACGGAVRGISCSTGFGRGFNHSQVLGRKLLMYFSGNPYFEGLPKKFKIAVEADYNGSRHLIQDLALVYVGEEQGEARYDVWIGGGLGRAPQAAILYQQQVPEKELLALTEAIIRVYAANVEPPKRLKTLIAKKGEAGLRRLLDAELATTSQVCFSDSFDKTVLPVSGECADLKLLVPVFAGELPAGKLEQIAGAATAAGVDYLLVTADQDLALLPNDQARRKQLVAALSTAGFAALDEPQRVMRICPGNHECRMGLSATRDLAKRLRQHFTCRLNGHELAISGCPNSCAQPQLADIGIIACKRGAGEHDRCRYDIYRRTNEELGIKVGESLTEEALLIHFEDLL